MLLAKWLEKDVTSLLRNCSVKASTWRAFGLIFFPPLPHYYEFNWKQLFVHVKLAWGALLKGSGVFVSNSACFKLLRLSLFNWMCWGFWEKETFPISSCESLEKAVSEQKNIPFMSRWNNRLSGFWYLLNVKSLSKSAREHWEAQNLQMYSCHFYYHSEMCFECTATVWFIERKQAFVTLLLELKHLVLIGYKPRVTEFVP